MIKHLTHYLPPKFNTNNVACLNGSAYRTTTNDIRKTTCNKCKERFDAGLVWHKINEEQNKLAGLF